MAAPMSDPPDPPPQPSSAVAEVRHRIEALDLPVDGTKQALSRGHLTPLRPRSSSDERQYSRRRRGRSLSPVSTRGLRSSASLSSASSSESLFGPSSSARSRRHRRSSLHARTQTRSRSGSRRPHLRRHGRQRRRRYDPKQRGHPSVPDEVKRGEYINVCVLLLEKCRHCGASLSEFADVAHGHAYVAVQTYMYVRT